MLYLPPKIEYITDTLKANGFEAYIVGGCIRDMLLGKEPHDFDVATSATPPEVTPLFEKTIPTGIKHGTVSVISEGEPVEVTTFRCDGHYTDSRRPDCVTFVNSLKEDLARRDFTVNAMAYGKDTGLIDYFGGEADLNNRLLRAVGNPALRFKEDALRIMRLFRFSSQLEFEIEPETLAAALSAAPGLAQISGERILTELTKTLGGKNPSAMKPLTDSGGLGFIGLKKSPDYRSLAGLAENPMLSLFAFFFLSESDAEKTLGILRASNQHKDYCRTLNRLFCMPFNSKADMKEMLAVSQEDFVKDALIFRQSIYGDDIKTALRFLSEISENHEPYRVSDLQINGSDLINCGITGEKIGEALEKLRQLVIKDPACNTRKALLAEADQLNRN